MRERRQWEKDAMYDAAMDERARLASLAKEGLCFSCEENLVNPQVPSHLCAECFGNKAQTYCDKGGCNRDQEVELPHRSYCKIHAVEYAHEQIEDYRSRKSKIEELKQEADCGVDQPSLAYNQPALAHKIGVQQEALEAIKESINLVMDQVEEVWPEGYNPPV